jgi:peroxiredoxin
MVLTLSLLWLSPLPTPAGELSEIPAASTPGFSLPDLTGRSRSLDEFTDKVVLVTFWASWCSPCIREMPSIQRLAATMADLHFAVVSVNVGEGKRRAQAAAGRLGIEFPVLLDKDSTAFKDWGADVMPTAYVLDRSGRIRYIARGPVEWDRVDIVETLKQLAAEHRPGGE